MRLNTLLQLNRWADRLALCAFVAVCGCAHAKLSHVDARHHHGHATPEAFARYAASMDKPERDAWQQPDALVAALGLRAGDVIADVGADPRPPRLPGGGVEGLRLLSGLGGTRSCAALRQTRRFPFVLRFLECARMPKDGGPSAKGPSPLGKAASSSNT